MKGADKEARPPLIIVSGAPAGGKTTLARRLGEALALPVLSKDDLKESLFETLGSPDRATSERLGRAAFALLGVAAEAVLAAGVGLVLEANYARGLAEPELAPLVARARAALVNCEAEPAELLRRFRERLERGGRHPGHHDSTIDFEAHLRAAQASGRYEPLALGVPTLRVDTTAGPEPRPSFAEIVAYLRRETLT